MKWFKSKNIKELKKEYKALSKIYHPDIKPTGDKATFIEITDEYNKLRVRCNNTSNFLIYLTLEDVVCGTTIDLPNNTKFIIPKNYNKLKWKTKVIDNDKTIFVTFKVIVPADMVVKKIGKKLHIKKIIYITLDDIAKHKKINFELLNNNYEMSIPFTDGCFTKAFTSGIIIELRLKE